MKASKIELGNEMTSAQIRGLIKVNEETFEQASCNLRKILDEPAPHRAYYLERLISALNLCSELAGRRAKYENDLRKAIQAGR